MSSGIVILNVRWSLIRVVSQEGGLLYILCTSQLVCKYYLYATCHSPNLTFPSSFPSLPPPLRSIFSSHPLTLPHSTTYVWMYVCYAVGTVLFCVNVAVVFQATCHTRYKLVFSTKKVTFDVSIKVPKR